ncbi:hypothetical protein FisN_9Lh074 [Fistulifera solaris]|uniref:Uncharacterized protein n=1 Tax=Fistulifera solaris TaxID=1519565 RepID=A0A1Z5KKZ7_FISSO|nr:hypothetical protein FisN_9Lh074 [Fistulifera solaris]|eukprot:GAX26805.1 hypothetical protein FisN_9Lh074 [Fistulifera solaris]
MTTGMKVSGETEIEHERSSFLFKGEGFLCFPLRDGCNDDSNVLTCDVDGDLCGGGDAVCVETTEGTTLCAAVAAGGAQLGCTSSRDCGLGKICVTFDGVCGTPNGCYEQKRGRR